MSCATGSRVSASSTGATGSSTLGFPTAKKKSKKEKESKGRKGIKKPNEAEGAKDENKYTFGGGIGGWALLNGHSGLGRLGLCH